MVDIQNIDWIAFSRYLNTDPDIIFDRQNRQAKFSTITKTHTDIVSRAKSINNVMCFGNLQY